MLEVAESQLGDGTGPADGIGKRGKDRPVPQAHHQRYLDLFPLIVLRRLRNVDRPEQRPGLLQRDFRRLALDHLFLDALDRCRRVEDDNMPVDQPVEEAA